MLEVSKRNVTKPRLAQITRLGQISISSVIGWFFVLALLVACDKTATTPPEVKLSTDKTGSLPEGGGQVVLRLEVLRGTISSVVFKKQDGSEAITVSKANDKGVFENGRTVTTTTTFVAEATGANGKISKTIEVKVTPRNPASDPKAPSSSAGVKGFANMALTTGAPSGLSVVVATIPGVTGQIVGQVKAETVKSKNGLEVIIAAGDGVLSFGYPARSKGLDSFEYTVTKAGREAKGKIEVDIQSVPSDIEVIDGNDTIATINGSSKSKILLTKDVRCTSDPCVTLDANQTLAGTMVIDGVTVQNSVKPKIIANIPGTRKSGTASCGTVDKFIEDNNGVFPPNEYNPKEKGECAETRVIVLSDDTTVEGIEITSDSTDEASTYFIAIFALGDRSPGSGDNVLDGGIKIKDVIINRSNGKPIYIKYTFQDPTKPKLPTPEYGTYTLEIDSLDLNDANDTLVIGNPQKLLFKNSTIELLQPKGNNAGPQPFGDNSGVQIASYKDGGDITLDNVDVYMESPKYRIDFDPEGDNSTPIEIFNSTAFASPVITKVTVKNSDVTFGTTNLPANEVSFKVQSVGGRIDISSASTNNKSVKGFLPVENGGGVVNGEIIVTK
jgi:hypothetical protein